MAASLTAGVSSDTFRILEKWCLKFLYPNDMQPTPILCEAAQRPRHRVQFPRHLANVTHLGVPGTRYRDIDALFVNIQPNVVGGKLFHGSLLTPHIAGVTLEANERVSALIAERVAEALTS